MSGETYRVVCLPGDGVGPEVVEGARRVVDTAGARHGFSFEWQEAIVGGAAIDRYGRAIRDEDFQRCAEADAVFLGAVGGPKWDVMDSPVRPEQALFVLRGGLDLYANLRPVPIEPALANASPLRPELLAGVDMLIIRELTGGLYFGKPSEERDGPTGREAVDTLPYTEAQIERVVRVGFELAQQRRKKLTSVDKANVLTTSRLWRKVVERLAPEYPDVTFEHRLVDSTAMLLITRPASFDVIVTENVFGDILSDEAGVLAGSLGMLPSASLGTRKTAYGTFGLYEPVHGSAPDIAGQGTANPIGAILSAAMMLRWSFREIEAAAAVESAVRGALDAGYRTRDLAAAGAPGDVRVVDTGAFVDAVVDHLGEPAGAAATAGSAAATGGSR